jgi:hypothetical protein
LRYGEFLGSFSPKPASMRSHLRVGKVGSIIVCPDLDVDALKSSMRSIERAVKRIAAQ